MRQPPQLLTESRGRLRKRKWIVEVADSGDAKTNCANRNAQPYINDPLFFTLCHPITIKLGPQCE
jgi:hypothetical protein